MAIGSGLRVPSLPVSLWSVVPRGVVQEASGEVGWPRGLPPKEGQPQIAVVPGEARLPPGAIPHPLTQPASVQHTKLAPDCRPLLVFVNPRSGGLKGRDLLCSFRKLLNPHQVFELTNGGPLPG